MYLWQPNMIRFMQDASENSCYYSELARRIDRYLPHDTHVCDAGCGLGYLSLELSRLCRHVSAVDIAPQTLEVLKKNILRFNCANISVIEGDIAQCSSQKPYDAMIFCFFGKTDEVLKIAKKQCSGRVIVIIKVCEKHRFTLADKPLEHDLLAKTQAYLLKLGVRFTCDTFALEMGQPFRTIADAVDFFRTYSRDDAPQSITENDIAYRLIRRQYKEFSYYLPSLKRMGMIMLDAGDIPDTIDQRM